MPKAENVPWGTLNLGHFDPLVFSREASHELKVRKKGTGTIKSWNLCHNF